MTKKQLRAMMRDENASLRRRHEYHQERRRRATLAGLHLPNATEFASGFPYLGASLATEVQAYAERLLPRLLHGPKDLVQALTAVTITPRLEQFQALAEAARSASSERRHAKLHLHEHVLRFEGYAAAAGCPEAPSRFALGIAAMSMQPGLPAQDRAALLSSSLGWSLLASDLAQREGPRHIAPRERARDLGALAVRRLLEAHTPEKSEPMVVDSRPHGHRPQRRPTAVREIAVSTPVIAPVTEADSLVVFRTIGASDTDDGQKIYDAWLEMLGVPLPVVPVPSDLDRALSGLLARFPHTTKIVAPLRSDLAGRQDAVFRPTILVGPPGSGKTAFARSLLSAMGIPHEVFPCGGAYHHALVGTDRHWNSAAPTMALRLIRQHRSASIGIVLDEVEKVVEGGGRRGEGGTFDALLALLEPSTASAYLDKYLQAPCDLSRVSWLATANSLDRLPAPLRDRCRVISFPEPGLEHLPVLASSLLRDTMTARGLDPRWALPLDGMELRALASAWPGGSLRRLGRLVDGVLDTRDVCLPRERN